MNTKGFLFAMIAICVMSGVASADYWNYVDEDGGNNTLISSYALDPTSIIETFDTGTTLGAVGTAIDGTPWNWGLTSTNGKVASGTVTTASSPWSYLGDQLVNEGRDTTQYITVPVAVNQSPQSLSVDFGQDYKYMGLMWGSMDLYNTLELFDSGSSTPAIAVLTLTGSDVAIPVADGGQTNFRTNRYVNIFLTDGKTFDNAVFTSSQYAFEFDNLAVGQVPVPGAVLLGILGLSAAGIKLRKFA